MKNRDKKWVCFLAVLTLVLAVLVLAARSRNKKKNRPRCRKRNPRGTEASAGNTVDMGDYVLTLPKDCTQQAREDGDSPSSVTAPLWAASRPWTARGGSSGLGRPDRL